MVGGGGLWSLAGFCLSILTFAFVALGQGSGDTFLWLGGGRRLHPFPCLLFLADDNLEDWGPGGQSLKA